MKAISRSTRALIDNLDQSFDWKKRLYAPDPKPEIIRRIAETGEFAAVPEIVSFALSNNQEVRQAAASAIHTLMHLAPSSSLAWLDQRMRELSPHLGHHRLHWHQLRPSQLMHLENFQSASVSLLGVASFHSSGYVREEAIHRLAKIMTGMELPFLLIRLNDWVSEIRRTTRNYVQVRLRPDYADHFIAHLTLVYRLQQAGRDDHHLLIEAVETLLKKSECRAALGLGLGSTDRFTRRISYRLAADSADVGLASLLDEALKDCDPVIRLWAARNVISAFDDEECQAYLSRLKRDRFMPVRREALRALLSKFPQRMIEELQVALLDTHASIREEAGYRLRQIAPIDMSGFYRDALKSGEESSLAAAISGLGVTGTADDANLLHPYINHPRVKIRRAVLQALSRLSGETNLDVFLNGLLDPSPSVSSEAKKALILRVRLVGGSRLWEVFSRATTTHLKLKALTLISRLDKWESIPFLIRAAGDPEQNIVEAAHDFLRSWLWFYNIQFSQPTSIQLESLKYELDGCQEYLAPEIHGQLMFLLKDSLTPDMPG